MLATAGGLGVVVAACVGLAFLGSKTDPARDARIAEPRPSAQVPVAGKDAVPPFKVDELSGFNIDEIRSVLGRPIDDEPEPTELQRSVGIDEWSNAFEQDDRLLVVDDNQDAANSLAMLLKLQGHEVRVAFSGLAALEMTKTYTPDVVFLDIGMPSIDGYEVARRMRQQLGLEKVVLAALTGWGQQEDRRRAADAGFNHHLVKPPESKALENVLAELKRREGQ